MATTIGDPYLLSTYSLPSKSKKGKEKVLAPEEQQHVFASHSSIGKKRDGQVTIAAQGDGIHILDLSDLHPISSHILGPSTSFASPAVTLTSREDEKSIRRTYVTVQSAPDVAAHDESKTVWFWKEVDGTSGSSERESFVLSHTVSSVLCSEENETLLFISRSGHLTQTDSSCNVLNTWTPPHNELKVVSAFAFPRQACSFIQGNNIPSNGTVLILLALKGQVLQLYTLVFGNDNEFVDLEPVYVSDMNTGVVGISCTSSGFLSVMHSNGLWRAYRIDVTQALLSSVSSSLTLRNLRLGAESQGSPTMHTRQISILGIRSSYTLVAGVTEGNNAEIALLLWDVQYGILLHSHILPIPSTLDNESLSFTVELVQGSSSQVLLILTPSSSTPKAKQHRTTVLVVPYSVPDASRLVDALGKAKAGARWLISDNSMTPSAADSALEDSLVKSQRDILQKVHDAIEEEKPDEADRLFFEWVKANTTHKEKKNKTEKKAKKKNKKMDVDMAESSSDSSVEAAQKPVEAEGENKGEQTGERGSIFNHSTVSRLLELVLHPESLSVPYSPKIFRFLVQRKLVGNSMVPGRVLPALLGHNDWDSIRECFHKMIDLPENDVLQVLVAVIKHHRKRSNDPNAMAVDAPGSSQISNLQSFLAMVIDYPASSVSWRNAIHHYLSDVEDLMSVLTVLDDWVTALTEKDQDVDFSLGEVKSVGKGVYMPIPKARKTIRLRGTTLPSMENILLFLQAILDSSFLKLLQYPQSYPLLHRLSQNLIPQVSFNSSLVPLIGSLAPFARAQSKAVADSRSTKKKDEVDWRKRRKAIQEQNAINLGPYQVEEITF